MGSLPGVINLPLPRADPEVAEENEEIVTATHETDDEHACATVRRCVRASARARLGEWASQAHMACLNRSVQRATTLKRRPFAPQGRVIWSKIAAGHIADEFDHVRLWKGISVISRGRTSKNSRHSGSPRSCGHTQHVNINLIDQDLTTHRQKPATFEVTFVSAPASEPQREKIEQLAMQTS